MAEEIASGMVIPELDTPCVFRRRPISIPADLRPGWRLGLIVLLMKNCCRGGKTTLSHLQVLSWGFRSQQAREQLRNAVEGRIPPQCIVVRFEPFLAQAIDFAVAERLIERQGGNRLILASAGLRLAKELEADPTAYEPEKAFMKLLQKKLTEGLIDKMFGWRSQV